MPNYFHIYLNTTTLSLGRTSIERAVKDGVFSFLSFLQLCTLALILLLLLFQVILFYLELFALLFVVLLVVLAITLLVFTSAKLL